MRNAAAALIVILIFSPPVLALDVSSSSSRSLVDCNDLAQGSRDAQLRYVQTYQPRQDPGKTFDDAISSCLDFITGFQVSIPSMWDGILAAMAKQLMQRVCQTARGQFDKAVGDAMQSVNGNVGMIPGVGVSTSSQVGVSVQGDNGTMMQNTANKAVDRVVNILK
ncbi:hypothetical protein [Sulfuricella sp.]|uniref:hypothetical protein n=1 Tax=Sulfuricella sp. TaxID=2099377 RepID=UPI002CC87BB0|nr:hypothetical protein [Sulfuricella sp.]HUX62235.1 hypothetical protein [Sulfuricella sp.]